MITAVALPATTAMANVTRTITSFMIFSCSAAADIIGLSENWLWMNGHSGRTGEKRDAKNDKADDLLDEVLPLTAVTVLSIHQSAAISVCKHVSCDTPNLV